MTILTVTITTDTSQAGDGTRKDQEANFCQRMLQKAERLIQPTSVASASLVDDNGTVCGSVVWGGAAINP